MYFKNMVNGMENFCERNMPEIKQDVNMKKYSYSNLVKSSQLMTIKHRMIVLLYYKYITLLSREKNRILVLLFQGIW